MDMATNKELSDLLLKRFRQVPNVTTEDCDTWIAAALMIEGFGSAEAVPQNQLHLIMILAQSEGAADIAMSAAHFFSYTDGDEHVDKTKTAFEYRQMSIQLRQKYEHERTRFRSAQGVKFRTMKRLDRDLK